MALLGSLRAVECHLASENMPTLNATRFECGRGVRCVDAAMGKGLLQIVMAIAQLDTPSWFLVGGSPAADKWARLLSCPKGADAWGCMHGRASIPAAVDCPQQLVRRGRAAAANKTLVALVVLRNLLLRGSRLSPLLEPGPAPPLLRSGRLNVSVALRGGDACDIVEHSRLDPHLFQVISYRQSIIRESKVRRRARVRVQEVTGRPPSRPHLSHRASGTQSCAPHGDGRSAAVPRPQSTSRRLPPYCCRGPPPCASMMSSACSSLQTLARRPPHSPRRRSARWACR